MVYEVVYKNDDAGGDAGGDAGSDEKGTRTIITEEVSERNLAYAANCPVTIHTTIDAANEKDSNRSNDGTILLCEPSSTNPGKFCYTIMIESSSSADDDGSSSQATYFESGIHGERIQYRKVVKQQQITENSANNNNNNTVTMAETADGGGGGATAALPSAAVHARSPQVNPPPPAINNNNNNNHNTDNAAKIIPPSVPPAVAQHAVHHHNHDHPLPPGEVKVPSSITCDSVSKSSHPTERSSSSSNKRKHASSSAMMLQDNASTLAANSDSHYKQDNNNTKYKNINNSNNNYYCNNDVRSTSQKSIDRYSNAANDVGSWKKGKVDVGSGDGSVGGGCVGGGGSRDDTSMLEIKTPSWLQRDRTNQLSLFFHLIGSKHDDKRGNRTIKDIEREANVDIRVNFLDNRKQTGIIRHPITLAITSRSRSSGMRDVHCAREQIQDLLLDFVGRDGSRGRLVYDVANSCDGDHRPANSTSRCVRAKDPFNTTANEDGNNSREVYMTLVHFPYKEVRGQKFGITKEFCVDFLLTSSLLTYLWNETDCYVKAVNCGSGIPVTR
eukprot:CAMPEP_0201677892 /NCGR_PEP_ID=MMETSP0494-20130426/45045_1 /ASSEMBLY_ACC=CAM_ASM_000839 /TAXON_ID=420259 /ORGANISM="Thalassiosira gravida, Strain GMp14c1" /LENGTH=555 /DNA_ID=CAMNT_0048160945 /DNA_START=209 /DNA_END=1872 /DNA_ORIENTATION=+